MTKQAKTSPAIKAFRALERNKKRVKEIRQLRDRLQKEMDKLEQEIRLGERVTLIHEGVAVAESWNGGYAGIDAPYNQRSSHVYINASTQDLPKDQQLWGLSLDTVGPFGGNRTDWCGAHWPDEKEVRRLALEWVIHGTKPDEKDRRYR